ncbi:MAG TPA: threonylcarbamoyl-AMP synthase [Candidatus Alectryocaccobium stercorigallinarum]|nr:threonylcarbamoyl-AMP synthase [Candidatus Alectryocaccobium stercorigallinarum]
MKARFVYIDRKAPDKKLLAEAGEIIKAGGLVAFPTETVYGLGGNALDPTAAKKIYAAKGRPSDNPLIIHIASWEDLEKITEFVPEEAKKLGEKYWPGPLTMIFKKSDIVPMEVTGGLDTVAVRFPSHEVARGFILAAGGFVAAPSANLSGRPSPTKASHVVEDLGERIDMIIDGGDADIGLESTIVDFTAGHPVVLRPGYITEEQMREIIGDVKTDAGIISSDSKIKPKAPGMKYRHYAPKGDLTIIEGGKDEVAGYINDMVKQKELEGAKTAVLCSEETRGLYECGCVITLGSVMNEDEIAHHLFDALRRLDDEKAEFIYSESFNTEHIGMAIMNRLLKAAGHKVINLKR